MGLYSRHVFPRLCDLSMRAPHIARLRRDVLAGANGEILEIGFGTGLNLGHYPEHVRHLTAVDPGGRHDTDRPPQDREEPHRCGPPGEERRGIAVRRRAVRLRGEHLDAVQHPGCQTSYKRDRSGTQARRTILVPGARAERRTENPEMATPLEPAPEATCRWVPTGSGYRGSGPIGSVPGSPSRAVLPGEYAEDRRFDVPGGGREVKARCPQRSQRGREPSVSAIALWIASRIPIGRIGNTFSAVRSRTTIGFFSPSIRCRPISKLVGVTSASQSPDR